MNRLKLIVLSSALSLITIGVFAGRAKFVNSTIYAWDGTNLHQLTGSAPLVDLMTGGTNQIITATGASGTYTLYSDASHSTPIRSANGF